MSIFNFLYLLLSYTFAYKYPTDAIFCSKVASPDQFNYLVEIVFNACGNPGICGGAVLDQTHVLTAAHCVSNFDEKCLSIIAGTTDLRSANRIKRKIKKIYLFGDHLQNKSIETFEYYKRKFLGWLITPMKVPFDNDIAVLRLSSALPLGEYISSVELPTSPLLPYDEVIPLASWGDIARSTSTEILRWANFKIMDEHDCYKHISKNRCHQFCVIHPQACSYLLHGDSGAPLVYANTVIGVAASSFLSPNDPAVFTKVFDYLEFIKKSLNDPS